MGTRLPTYFLSHGGGPWPWMKQQQGGMYDMLEASLRTIPAELGVAPRAVLVVSGHWEAREPRIMAAAQPGMVYDYYGFPEHTYSISYPAPGSPTLALQIQHLLQDAGIAAPLDEDRGFDHGTFVPLAVMYPQADIPVVQLSLGSSYDPDLHRVMGRALAPLRDEGVLIVGSGLSYHNLRMMGPAAHGASKAFDDWLQRTVVGSTPEQREQALRTWDQAPAARLAHPREDHLLPLLVASAAAHDEAGQCIYHEEAFFGGVVVSSFRFGGAGM